MVGHNSVTNMDSSFLRKIRKTAVEKKRRDRISTSISTLKMFLTRSCNRTSTPKLDKADILEQTLNHLVQLRNQHFSIIMAAQVAAYKAGFKESARETIRFLSATHAIDVDSLSILNAHLQSVYLKKTTPALVFAGTRSQLKRPRSSIVQNLDVSIDTPSRGYYGNDYMPSPINKASFSSSSCVSSDSEISSSSSDTSGSTSNYSDICWSNSSVSTESDSDMSSVNYSNKDLRDILQEEQPWRPW